MKAERELGYFQILKSLSRDHIWKQTFLDAKAIASPTPNPSPSVSQYVICFPKDMTKSLLLVVVGGVLAWLKLAGGGVY